MTVRLVVLPAAPLLLPQIAQVTPEGVAEVLQACDLVLASAVAATDEVAIVSAPDVTRDLVMSGSAPRARAAAVADSLLNRVGYTGVRLHVGPQERSRGAATWLLMADGSAAVGPKSPRPGEAGARFDEVLIQRLADGDLASLVDVGDGDAMAAGCLTAAVWRRLGELAGPHPTCQSMLTFAPFGVRYFVGSWTTEAGIR